MKLQNQCIFVRRPNQHKVDVISGFPKESQNLICVLSQSRKKMNLVLFCIGLRIILKHSLYAHFPELENQILLFLGNISTCVKMRLTAQKDAAAIQLV